MRIAVRRAIEEAERAVSVAATIAIMIATTLAHRVLRRMAVVAVRVVVPIRVAETRVADRG